MQKQQRFTVAFLNISELILLFDLVLHGGQFHFLLRISETKIIDLPQKFCSRHYKSRLVNTNITSSFLFKKMFYFIYYKKVSKNYCFITKHREIFSRKPLQYQCLEIFSETPPKKSSRSANMFLKTGTADPMALIALGAQG